jgi:hypothetical protein
MVGEGGHDMYGEEEGKELNIRNGDFPIALYAPISLASE